MTAEDPIDESEPQNNACRSRSIHIRDPEIVDQLTTVMNQLEMDPAEFQAEQQLIHSIIERRDGWAWLAEIASEIGAEPHKLIVPINLLHQEEVVVVSDTREGRIIYLPGNKPDFLD